jgi:hypothetical protein
MENVIEFTLPDDGEQRRPDGTDDDGSTVKAEK